MSHISCHTYHITHIISHISYLTYHITHITSHIYHTNHNNFCIAFHPCFDSYFHNKLPLFLLSYFCASFRSRLLLMLITSFISYHIFLTAFTVTKEFRIKAESVKKTDFKTIEHLLRYGYKQKKMIEMAGFRTGTATTEKA